MLAALSGLDLLELLKGDVSVVTAVEINYDLRYIKDTKTVGEAATQPTVRLPPLREGRHMKLFAAAMAIRFSPEDGTLPPGDAFVLMDGGREGISPCILKIQMYIRF